MSERPRKGATATEAAKGHAPDPEQFARNLARAVEEAGRAASAYLKPREEGKIGFDGLDDVAEALKSLSGLGMRVLSSPAQAAEAQGRLWSAYAGIWGDAVRHMMGRNGAAPEPKPTDRRFQDPAWTENPYFDFIRRAYLATSDWANDLVDEVDGMDEHERHKARFYVRRLAEALSPSNFLPTSPELIRETLSSDGANLARGMKMLAEDIAAGGGVLKLRQSDAAKFKVGENLASTPGKVVFENELMQLIQYDPTTPKVLKRPLLIVPPWINKFYVLDLTPEKSFIRWCVEAGHTVFVVSWVNPTERQAKKTFEDYVEEGLFAALDAVEQATGESEVNAIGYCVGGTMLSAALALMAATGDKRIASATLFTAQVDFTFAGDLKVFVDEPQIAALEKRMAKKGYLEGSAMANVFNLLRANDLIWPYVVDNYFRGKEPFAFDILYWNSDSTRLAAATHSSYLRSCYLENRLARGEMVLRGKKLDLKKIKVPIYSLATREDHIAPAPSVFLGSRMFGGNVDFVLAGSGHIAGVVNPPAKKKYQFWTGALPAAGRDAKLEDWIASAEEHPGSWWPHWHAWVEAKDKHKVAARSVGSGKLKPIEDAPGRYVKAKD